jgi:hypothetical protein
MALDFPDAEMAAMTWPTTTKTRETTIRTNSLALILLTKISLDKAP